MTEMPALTDDFVVFRVSGRLAVVPLSQVVYLTSEPEDGIPLRIQHRHDVAAQHLHGADDLWLARNVRSQGRRSHTRRAIQFVTNFFFKSHNRNRRTDP